jgi:hypothetical protein
MERPWMFYNNMCVRTFVQQAKIMTGREFVKEVENGQKHHALSDCRTQIRYLVIARTALLPQPVDRTPRSPETSFSIANLNSEQVLERILPSPETSFSKTDGEVEQTPGSAASSFDPFEETLSEHEAFLEMVMSSKEIEREVANEDALVPRARSGIMLPSPETSFSSAGGDVEEALRSATSSLLIPPPTENGALGIFLSTIEAETEAETETVNGIPITTGSPIGRDEQDLSTNFQMQNSASEASSGHRVRTSPYKVVKQTSNSNLRRRNVQVKTPRQLLTPETSFNAEEYEKE